MRLNLNIISSIIEAIKPIVLYVNPYTITLTSAAEEIGTDSDTYQMILVFTVDLEASVQAHSFADKNLVIMDRGKSTWEYDLEDALIAPQMERIKISDPDGYLTGLLFDLSAEQAATQKQFTVEIKRTGTQTFKGKSLEDSIESVLIDSANGSYELSFEAMPDTDVLNNTGLYDSRKGTILDPLGYGASAVQFATAIITDIYEVVNAGVNVTIDNNWLFGGNEIGGPGSIADRPFTEVKIKTDGLFQVDTYALGNLSDTLKHLARQFGSFTGFNSFDEAFFRRLFHYDTGNTQTLGTVLSVRSQYLFNKMEFFRLLDPATAAVIGVEGSYTELENKKFDIDDPFFNTGGTDGPTQSIILNGGTDYLLEDIEDDDWQVATAAYQITFLGFWARFRGNIGRLRTEEFVVNGVDYDITKVFTYTLEGNAFKYQPIFLQIDWEKAQTKIRALNLGV